MEKKEMIKKLKLSKKTIANLSFVKAGGEPNRTFITCGNQCYTNNGYDCYESFKCPYSNVVCSDNCTISTVD